MQANPQDHRLVLFISDLEDEVDMYSLALELGGFRTVHAFSQAETSHLSAEAIPAAIVVDGGQFPSALSVSRARRLQTQAGPSLPVILLTTHATGAHPDTPRRIGCDRVLMKPCAPAALVQALDDVLKQRARTQPTAQKGSDG